MNTQELLNPECWARKTFGSVKLKDVRRTGRAVKQVKRLNSLARDVVPTSQRPYHFLHLCQIFSEDYIQQLASCTSEDLVYLGIMLYGSKKTINRLAGNFRLLRETSAIV